MATRSPLCPLSPVADLIRIQQQDFDLAREYQALRRDSAAGATADTGIGAIVTFTGLVRDFLNVATEALDTAATLDADAGTGSDRGATSPAPGLYLQHYPGMTERSLTAIVDEARRRWRLNRVRVIHRVGQLAPGDQIVFVGVAAAHRGEAFAACEFIMDYLKIRAMFWKKESGPRGSRWVESRDSDQAAASRWQSDDRD